MRHIVTTFFALALFATFPVHAEDTAATAVPPSDPAIEKTVTDFLKTKTTTEEDAQPAGYQQADLNGDSKPEIVIVWTTMGPTYWSNTLSVLQDKGEGYKEAGAFDLLGMAQLKEIKDGLIIVDQTLPKEGDPICCPTDKQVLSYRWDGQAVTQITN